MATSQAFGLLNEGALGAFTPEVAYVRQDDKVHFFAGDPKLTESVDASAFTIVESFDDLDLEERVVGGETIKTPKNAKWFVEGPFQRSDTKNANQRTYPRSIWEKLIADAKSNVMKSVTERAMIGHLEHPADGRTNGKEGAILTTTLKLREDGVVWGGAEVLDTPNGRIVQEYIRKKIKWGVSSRGNGSVGEDGSVKPDYALETFDAVMRPSTPGAHPKLVADVNEDDPSKADGNTSPAGPGKPLSEELTKEVQSLVESVSNLKMVDITDLDESAATKMAGDLLAALGATTDAATEGKLRHEKALEMQTWLVGRMKSLQESAVAGIDVGALIFKAVGDANEEADADKAEALRKVVDSFDAKIQAAEDARSETAAELVVLQTENAGLVRSHGLIVQERDELLLRLDELARRLVVASESLIEISSEDVSDPIEAAVAEAILKHPGLAEFRPVLIRAVDENEVGSLIESLLPAVTSTGAVAPASTPTPRSMLPSGCVVESVSSVPGGKTKPINESRGANVAAQALVKMQGQQ